jgi:hypothetical protein
VESATVGPLVSRAKHEIAFALTLSLLRLCTGSPRGKRFAPSSRRAEDCHRPARSANFTFGDAGGNMLVGPAFLNTDFSLLKNFPIHEIDEVAIPGRVLQRL